MEYFQLESPAEQFDKQYIILTKENGFKSLSGFFFFLKISL